MITYKLDNLSERDALFRQFAGQYDAQPAYVQMDEDGIVSAYYSGEIGYSVPSYVWHHRTLRWRVHASTDGHALRDLLQSDAARALLERIHDGHTVEWINSNFEGILTREARDTESDLEDLLHDCPLVNIVSAQNYLFGEWNTLPEIWPDDMTIDEAVETVEDGLAYAPDDMVLKGDIKETILDQVLYLFECNKPLHQSKIETLLSRNLITAEMVATYHEHSRG